MESILRNQLNSMVKEYWNHCQKNLAHIKHNWEIIKGGRRERHFRKSFLDEIDFNNKIVIDYGCGGGWFGKYLFEHHGIKKYIGIDVSGRSLQASSDALKKYKDKVELQLTPQEFNNFKADIFVSLACIQHFPSILYLDDFLENINRSNVKIVVLHIRKGLKTKYKNPYTEKGGDVLDAGRTNAKYISEKLTNYKLIKNYDIKFKSKAVYLIYERNI